MVDSFWAYLTFVSIIRDAGALVEQGGEQESKGTS